MNYHYIDDDAGLETFLKACASAPVIALDTEFARFNTYYPMIGLLQIGLGHDNYLLDPLPIKDLSGLQALMKCPDTLKVVHSGSEDMEVFQYWLDCVPTPIFDTQIAAAMLGIGYALSYQKLVAHFLSIDIPKGETRSDWLARPLRQSQLDYAAQDVIHLFEIYPMLAESLAERGRVDWVLSESFKLTQDLPTKIDPDEAYLKLKGVSSLNARQLQYLRSFCAFREREAQTRNVPRNRVVDNDELIAFINQFREEFNTLPVEDICFPRGVNGLKKYECPVELFKKGTPIHVKGVIHFNKLVKKHGLEMTHPLVKEGEKIKFVYLKEPNPIGNNTIAIQNVLPKEFDLDRFIDKTKQFDKSFLEPVKSVTDAIGWDVEKRFTIDDFF